MLHIHTWHGCVKIEKDRAAGWHKMILNDRPALIHPWPFRNRVMLWVIRHFLKACPFRCVVQIPSYQVITPRKSSHSTAVWGFFWIGFWCYQRQISDLESELFLVAASKNALWPCSTMLPEMWTFTFLVQRLCTRDSRESLDELGHDIHWMEEWVEVGSEGNPIWPRCICYWKTNSIVKNCQVCVIYLPMMNQSS